MLSQRSQMVVAPIVTEYSQDGLSVCSSSRAGDVEVAGTVRASSTSGVPTNPVPIR